MSNNPLQTISYKWNVQTATAGLKYFAKGTWGAKLLGGTISMVADAIASAAQQAFYARLPGHQQQAPDSLTQSGFDCDLVQFRGETQPNYGARVKNRWADYRQAGTWQQIINVVNQWGNAGWPISWTDLTSSNLVESGSATQFTFTLTIPYGNIVPPWTPWLIGPSYTVGEEGLYVGIGESIADLPMLLYLVRKWKPSRSLGYVIVYWGVSNFVTFTVG